MLCAYLYYFFSDFQFLKKRSGQFLPRNRSTNEPANQTVSEESCFRADSLEANYCSVRRSQEPYRRMIVVMFSRQATRRLKTGKSGTRFADERTGLW